MMWIFKEMVEASGNCYELVNTYPITTEPLFKEPYRDWKPWEYGRSVTIFKLKKELPHCEARMLKKNYYKGNKSLGTTTDFELGWFGPNSPLGVDSPLVDEIMEHRARYAAEIAEQS